MATQKQLDNLKKGKSTQFRTGEEQAKVARKGGKASGVARREKKTLLQTMEVILSMPLKDGDLANLDSIKSLKSLKGKNLSVQEGIVLAQVAKALNGDAKSAKLVMGILAEKQEKPEESAVKIIDDF